MATGYEDIDRLTSKQNTLLNNQQKKQEQIINQQTQMNVDELNREKQKLQEETTKTNRGLYTDYQKEVNQYGARAEQLASQGLLNSGYAETTKLGLYNTYQKNVTETLNNSQRLKSDFDFQISQARQSGSLQIAQAAVDMYAQKMQLLTQQYEMRENRKQFLYQQQRDKVSDRQWQKSFDQQVKQAEIENKWKQKSFDYQKQRDKVADSQWQKTYNLQKKKSSSASSRRSSRGKKTYTVNKKSSGGLSKNAQKLMEKATKVINSRAGGFSGAQEGGKEIARVEVYNQYKKGTITYDEASQIFDKLGI